MLTLLDNPLDEIVSSIFATLLHWDVAPCERLGEAHDEALLATVRIRGELNYVVALLLPAEPAGQIAASLFRRPLDQLLPTDIEDTAAELVNMIGGNLKGLSNTRSELTIPEVSRVNSHAAFGIDMNLDASQVYETQFGTFKVAVLRAY